MCIWKWKLIQFYFLPGAIDFGPTFEAWLPVVAGLAPLVPLALGFLAFGVLLVLAWSFASLFCWFSAFSATPLVFASMLTVYPLPGPEGVSFATVLTVCPCVAGWVFVCSPVLVFS
jgi:hypothetical protein